MQNFPGGNSKVRSSAGFALLAYQAFNSGEDKAVHMVSSSLQSIEETSTSKLGNDANRATKVFEMKGGANSSEVRRPAVSICMNVMTTVFCRKVLFSFFFPFFFFCFSFSLCFFFYIYVSLFLFPSFFLSSFGPSTPVPACFSS